MLAADDWYTHVSLQGRVVAASTNDVDLADIDRLAQHYRGHPYPNREAEAGQRLDRRIRDVARPGGVR